MSENIRDCSTGCHNGPSVKMKPDAKCSTGGRNIKYAVKSVRYRLVRHINPLFQSPACRNDRPGACPSDGEPGPVREGFGQRSRHRHAKAADNFLPLDLGRRSWIGSREGVVVEQLLIAPFSSRLVCEWLPVTRGSMSLFV